MTPDEPVDLDEAQQMADAATDGPWAMYDANEGTSSPPAWSVCNDAYVNPLSHPENVPAVDITVTYGTQADATFIAAARTLVPRMVRELGQARAELAAARLVCNLTGITPPTDGERGDALSQAWQDYEHAYGPYERVPDATIRELAARRREIRERTLRRLRAESPGGAA